MKRVSLAMLTLLPVALLGCASVREVAKEVAREQADKVREEVKEYAKGKVEEAKLDLANNLEKKGQEFKDLAAKAREEGDTSKWLLYSALGLGGLGGGAALKGLGGKKEGKRDEPSA